MSACECAHGAGECRLHSLAECGSLAECEACAEDAHDADNARQMARGAAECARLGVRACVCGSGRAWTRCPEAGRPGMPHFCG